MMILDTLEQALRGRLEDTQRRPFVLGLCGAQGSGKSTLAAALRDRLVAAGTECAILSLDDLYKTKTERAEMARTIHPLFATRGVPGTHDLDLAFTVLDQLGRGQGAPLPRFDKARDNRLPVDRWDIAPAGTRVLIFEGWCVGARPQPDEALAAPINRLERDEDIDGGWRTYANTALSGAYRLLFARIDLLALLAAPGFEVVQGWRTEQEQQLRDLGGGGMTDVEIGRFVQHYERLTRHILADMPGYADIVIPLDANRGPRAIDVRNPR